MKNDVKYFNHNFISFRKENHFLSFSKKHSNSERFLETSRLLPTHFILSKIFYHYFHSVCPLKRISVELILLILKNLKIILALRIWGKFYLKTFADNSHTFYKKFEKNSSIQDCSFKFLNFPNLFIANV